MDSLTSYGERNLARSWEIVSHGAFPFTVRVCRFVMASLYFYWIMVAHQPQSIWRGCGLQYGYRLFQIKNRDYDTLQYTGRIRYCHRDPGFVGQTTSYVSYIVATSPSVSLLFVF